MTTEEERVLTLHRYYAAATLMESRFRTTVEAQRANPRAAAEDLRGRMPDPEVMIWMGCWYGFLYVVIEGWKELRLSDSAVDAALSDVDGREHANLALLRRYRNGMFHYQRAYHDEKFTNFFKEPTSVHWIHALNRALDSYFLRFLASVKESSSGERSSDS